MGVRSQLLLRVLNALLLRWGADISSQARHPPPPSLDSACDAPPQKPALQLPLSPRNSERAPARPLESTQVTTLHFQISDFIGVVWRSAENKKLREDGLLYARILLKLGCLQPAEVAGLRGVLADRLRAHPRAHDKSFAGSLWARERPMVELAADIEAVWVRTPPPPQQQPDDAAPSTSGRGGGGASSEPRKRARAAPRYEDTIERATEGDPEAWLPILAVLLQRSGGEMEAAALNAWFWRLQAFLEARRAAHVMARNAPALLLCLFASFHKRLKVRLSCLAVAHQLIPLLPQPTATSPRRKSCRRPRRLWCWTTAPPPSSPSGPCAPSASFCGCSSGQPRRQRRRAPRAAPPPRARAAGRRPRSTGGRSCARSCSGSPPCPSPLRSR